MVNGMMNTIIKKAGKVVSTGTNAGSNSNLAQVQVQDMILLDVLDLRKMIFEWLIMLQNKSV